MSVVRQELQKLGELVTEFQKTNDERIDMVDAGVEGKAKELDAKLDTLNSAIDESQAKIKDFEKELAKTSAANDMLEALESLKQDPEKDYAGAFVDALRKGFDDPVLNAKANALQKDITLASNAGGGFALPKEIGADVDALLLKLSDIAANVKSVQVGTSDYQELVSIFGGTSGWVAETGTRSATATPTLRSQAPTWGELYAYPQISEWSIQDIFFNVVDWLVNDVAEGMATTLSSVIFNGDGSNKPTGMTNTAPVSTADYASPLRAAAAYQYVPVTGSVVLDTSPTTSPLTLGPLFNTMDDIITLVYTLNRRYRDNAQFAMNTITQGHVRKLKDSQGTYLWQPSLQVGQPDSLLGYDVFTWEDLGNPTTTNALPVAFGDFAKAYLLANRTELMMQSESITNPGYVRFYVRRRYGGVPLNNDAVKFLKVALT